MSNKRYGNCNYIIVIVELRQYDKGQLIEAVQSVNKGAMTITEAAKHYNVPRTTLSDHVHGKIEDFRSSGPSRELPDDLEEAVVDYLMYRSQQNFPLRRKDTRTLIVVNIFKQTIHFIWKNTLKLLKNHIHNCKQHNAVSSNLLYLGCDTKKRG